MSLFFLYLSNFSTSRFFLYRKGDQIYHVTNVFTSFIILKYFSKINILFNIFEIFHKTEERVNFMRHLNSLPSLKIKNYSKFITVSRKH